MANEKEELDNILENLLNAQLEENDPPEINSTFFRLISEGCSEREAKDLIKMMLSFRLLEATVYNRPFSDKDYVEDLSFLTKPKS